MDAPPTLSTVKLIRADVRSMIVRRSDSGLLHAASVASKLLLYPRIQAVVLFRLSHACLRWRLHPLAFALQMVQQVVAGAEIHPAAQIGPGFCLVHSRGVVIGDRVKIGSGFTCLHGVTVGDSGHGDGQPTLGHRVRLSAGAKVLGGIHLGDGAVVGANAVVLIDVPPGGVAVGVPARVVKVRPADNS